MQVLRTRGASRSHSTRKTGACSLWRWGVVDQAEIGLFYLRIMSPRKYLAGVALSVSMLTVSWAAQRTILKALPACPDIKDFTDWVEAIDKGDASRAVDIIDGKGCVEVNKGDVVEFERLLTHPFVVCVRPMGQSQCFWTSPFAISPQPRKR
jgi:hypothetical protein